MKTKGLFIRIECDIRSKPKFQDIVDETGKHEVEVLGALSALWTYFQQHTEDGVMSLSLKKLARRIGWGEVAFWECVASEGWLDVDEKEGTISIPMWRENFYEGSQAKQDHDRQENAKRQKRHRGKAEEPSHDSNADVTRDTTVTEALRENPSHATENYVTKSNGPIDRIELDNKNKQIDRIEEDSGSVSNLSDLSGILNSFWQNLSDAGMALPTARPFWLRKALQENPDTYLAASKELASTALLEGERPVHIGNFKNLGWVEKLRDGHFSTKAPPAAVRRERQDGKRFIHPAGKWMDEHEFNEWKTTEDGKSALEAYKHRSQANSSRDEHRGDTPSEEEIKDLSKIRPKLKNANETDVDTNALKADALAQIAAFEKANGGG